MTGQKPAVVLVHGAFAESASWNGVVEQLLAKSIDVIAVANPLRSVSGDAAYVRDVIAGLGKPVVLVGHSYGGLVITEAAAANEFVASLVYVCAFAPEQGESASNCPASSRAAHLARPSPPIRSPPAATSSLSGGTRSTSSSPPTSQLPKRR